MDIDPFDLAAGMKADLLALEADGVDCTDLHAKMVTGVVFLVDQGILTDEQGEELIGEPTAPLKGAHTDDGGTGKSNPPPP